MTGNLGRFMTNERLFRGAESPEKWRFSKLPRQRPSITLIGPGVSRKRTNELAQLMGVLRFGKAAPREPG
jgi:hypothetical protein